MLVQLLPIPLCVMKVCMHVKRSAESKPLKVHPVASKTLTQSMLPQNASLEISHFPLFTSWVL